MSAVHRNTTYLFAGGGTGGHIFPAIAIAEELLAREAGGVTDASNSESQLTVAHPKPLPEGGASGTRVRFLISNRELDAKILRGQTLAVDGRAISPEFDVIPAQPVGIRPRALVRFVSSWGKSVRAARRVIREARRDSAVVMVAMGGFVAAPCVQAARAEGVPIVLVNLDAVPGKANRWIAKHADEIVTAAPIAPHLASAGRGTFTKWKQIAPIVRRGAAWSGSKREARVKLGLDPDRPTLMITGGSQGAGTINSFMRGFVGSADVEQGSLRCGQRDGWQVLHQVGPQQSGQAVDEQLRELYRVKGVPAVVAEFVNDLGTWWGASDLVVCRAGAGNVGEVWANKVPAIFMPYPFHKDEHQKFNAAVLEQSGGALVLKDEISVPNMYSIGPVLASLLKSPEKLAAMRASLEELGPADGAVRAAEVIAGMATRGV